MRVFWESPRQICGHKKQNPENNVKKNFTPSERSQRPDGDHFNAALRSTKHLLVFSLKKSIFNPL
jgi:hypothetical protein